MEENVPGFMAQVVLNIPMITKNKKKRKYYRKCGVCGKRQEQSEMIRCIESPNGWLCVDCYAAKHIEYEDFGEE